MNVVMSILAAIIFVIGVTGFPNLAYKIIRKGALTKVNQGLPSLQSFTKKLTK